MYLWLACVFALCAGYYVAFYRLGGAIDMQHDLTARAATIVRANAEILATRPTLEQTEDAVDARMRELQLRADHATTVARFIRESARIATTHGTGLVQIDERGPVAADARASRPGAGDGAFETTLLDVTLTGSYRDLVATIRGLTQAPIAMQIEIAAIERGANTPFGNAPLTARLHVSLERLADVAPAPVLTPEETIHARSF